MMKIFVEKNLMIMVYQIKNLKDFTIYMETDV